MVQQCRIVNLTVSLVIVLSIYNILLTVKLLSIEDKQCTSALPQLGLLQFPNQVQKPNLLDAHLGTNMAQCPPDSNSQFGIRLELDSDTFLRLNLKLGRWDNRLLFKYYDHFLTGDKFTEMGERYSVCLATQSSLDKLGSLVEVANMWHGSISMAVFATGEEELNMLLLYIIYLRQCYNTIKERVSFHLALSKEKLPESISLDLEMLGTLDCNIPEVTVKHLMKRINGISSKWRAKSPYPQNHLRNLARKNCNSKFVFLTDVDIVPSHLFVQKLDKFLAGYHCESKCAFVVPTYELDHRVKFPPNKTELVRFANKGLARPFHHRVFIYNQFATNFTKWQNNTQSDVNVHISHRVTNFEFLYEPFYVATDMVPPHDERFIGYGYTRNTQVYEMFISDYEFYVLSPIFTVHWGLQVKRSRPPWREHQNNQNRKLFEVFKREIFARYKKDPLHMLSPVRKS